MKTPSHAVSIRFMFMAALFGLSVVHAAQPGASKFRPFDPGAVTLLPGPLLDAFERDLAYVRSLDPDRLLYNFRVNAGLPTNAVPLGGWEKPDCELRGHFTGHYLSACALLYSATGDSTILQHGRAVVAGLAECQHALGRSGYISAFPEEFIDRVIDGKRVWAPWYTLHKIYAGLLDMAVLCHDGEALDILNKASSWIRSRVDPLSDREMQSMLKTEFGGMGEVLANLSAFTGDSADLALARKFDKRSFTDPLAEGVDRLKGLHANTHIPQAIAAARLYELTGEPRYHDIASYFWKEVVTERTYATGGTSNYEYWRGDPGQLADELSDQTHENCCSYNMLRLSRHLFSWTGDPAVADYYERTLWNAVLPTQNPDSGAGIMYSVPLHGGLFKVFGVPDSSYWCCTGTGIESFATLSNSIYFHDSSNMVVALYAPSEVHWSERGITLRQETRFPEDGLIHLHITLNHPETFTLYLRVPGWVKGKPFLSINGRRSTAKLNASRLVAVRRTWRNDDRVDLRFPMSLSLDYLPGDSSCAAVQYGPVVLVGELGTEEMTPQMQEGYGYPDVDRMATEGPAMPTPQLKCKSGPLNSWIRPVAGEPLTFRITPEGNLKDVTLIPFFRLFHQRYAIYWQLGGGQPMQGERSDSAGDSVVVGEKRSERQHNFQAYRFTRGSRGIRPWVASPLWFRYDLAVLPRQTQVLRWTWLADSTTRDCEVLIDGQPLQGYSAPAASGDVLTSVAVPLTPDFVGTRTRLAIKFRGAKDHGTPRLFDLRITRE